MIINEQNLKNILKKYITRINFETLLKDVNNKLLINNVEKVIAVFLYNKGEYLELSLLTKPTTDIKIKIDFIN